jgi:hypothetical protein
MYLYGPRRASPSAISPAITPRTKPEAVTRMPASRRRMAASMPSSSPLASRALSVGGV